LASGPKCPSYKYEPCKAPHVAPWDHPNNFTGVYTILCKYKYDICTQLRLEHRACRKAHSRQCAPVPKKNAVNCARSVSRNWNKSWKKACKDEHTLLMEKYASLEEQLRKLKAMRSSLTGGLGMVCGEDGSPIVPESVNVMKPTKKGWFGGEQQKQRSARRNDHFGDKLSAQLSNIRKKTVDLLPDGVDQAELVHAMEVDFAGIDKSLKGIDNSIEAVENMMDKLDDQVKELTARCDPSSDPSGLGKNVEQHCEEQEKSARVFDRHEEKCAKRLADMLAQQAKMEALVAESERRLHMLDTIQLAIASLSDAWSEGNLTEAAFANLGNVLTSVNETREARKILSDVIVTETALCQEVLPTLQLSMLGKGVSKEQVWCPTPTGTFIAGRDLPDWAPHFLVGVGIILGLLLTSFLKATPMIFAVMTEHPILFVLLFVAVFAGRFA